ncbi:hypothetical protein [Clostridium sp.]
MNNRKLNMYFFGDVGEYDCYNPAYICGKQYTSEILFLISSKQPFSISKSEISSYLNIEDAVITDIIHNLEMINAIEVKENTFRIKFPIFLEQDVIKMEKYIINIGEVIGKKIVSLRDILYKNISDLRCSKCHSNERILYHIICDKVFDDTAFDFFAEKSTFCTSKSQPGNRNYIIVAYEDSEAVAAHSNTLLCSSNNYRSCDFTFNSFGDSNGSRKDMYRFFRLIQDSIDNKSSFHELNISYIKIIDNMNSEIAAKCGELMCNIISNDIKYNQLDEKEKDLARFLKELKYIDIGDLTNIIVINVPVFYEFENTTVIKNLSDIILINIYPIVEKVFEDFNSNASELTSVRHNVDIKEIANELWHQIFGATNEYLVKEGFVSSPYAIDGEGRYLRSITINRC